jgi:hypothetical protein
VSRPGMLRMVRHEARALWPVWAATAAACLAAGLAGSWQFALLGRTAYFAGSAALAALAIGHEYTHGTLPALLTLPIDRRRLLLAKLLAVLPMLVTLAPMALTIGPGAPYFERGTVIGALSLLAVIAAAPSITMLTGSPLAGVVFGLGVAGGLHLVVFGLVALWLKLANPVFAGNSGNLQAIFDRALAASLVLVAVAAAAGGWRRFMTLEATDHRDTHVTWPRWLRSSMVLDEEELVAAAKRSWPYWLLVKKELRIQQLSIAVAAINVGIWLSALAVVGDSSESDRIMASLAMLYGAFVAALIGALASAEERHLATLAWQMLLPIAAWKQFAVKTTVALTLTLLLAFALPLLLARGELPVTLAHAATLLLLTLGCLFVSSLCNNGLIAMAMAAPLMFVITAGLGWSGRFTDIEPNEAALLMAALAGPTWWFAYLNHRTVR